MNEVDVLLILIDRYGLYLTHCTVINEIRLQWVPLHRHRVAPARVIEISAPANWHWVPRPFLGSDTAWMGISQINFHPSGRSIAALFRSGERSVICWAGGLRTHASGCGSSDSFRRSLESSQYPHFGVASTDGAMAQQKKVQCRANTAAVWKFWLLDATVFSRLRRMARKRRVERIRPTSFGHTARVALRIREPISSLYGAWAFATFFIRLLISAALLSATWNAFRTQLSTSRPVMACSLNCSTKIGEFPIGYIGSTSLHLKGRTSQSSLGSRLILNVYCAMEQT